MKFRYWLANFISGGELMRAQYMEVANARLLGREEAKVAKCQREANEGWATATLRMIALQEIAAMPTPKANATVRRMAAVAREALE